VLAVGDAQFQRKCLGKMEEVSKVGRTVLFVSHQNAAIRRLCARGMVMHAGLRAFEGPVDAAVNEYMSRLEERVSSDILASRTDREGTGRLRVQNVRITNSAGEARSHVCSGDDVQIRMKYSTPAGVDIPNVLFAAAFDSPVFGRVFMCQSNLVGANITASAKGGEAVLSIPRLPLTTGIYTGNVWCSANGVKGEVLDFVRQAFILKVEQGDFYRTGQVPTGGVFLLQHAWTAS
jgi:lipopolysaccharide transport system ATP-binding protein